VIEWTNFRQALISVGLSKNLKPQSEKMKARQRDSELSRAAGLREEGVTRQRDGCSRDSLLFHWFSCVSALSFKSSRQALDNQFRASVRRTKPVQLQGMLMLMNPSYLLCQWFESAVLLSSPTSRASRVTPDPLVGRRQILSLI
jgi:hypothetical protein